ncbi:MULTISPECIES: ABC transporter permease [unclassified Rhizobium]|uniref:ABC transporter permease n=1 Tax=unclassified Rhizobium TaxID=2613769 RepID=UPI000DE15B1A|nr:MULTISPECIES: ABC transporter permease [unclassified Rhizobium]MBB3289153.1 peptide/nickel transport system permease protein [Rhizobium sp. BK252]MBB3403895.1 peptide/nickel transport system permease protein [Rhizobium sp. BK289]MBB3416436.1 peptide/nickel transport system permease protein [Rhizobium sp. BK284]MBB3484358.1 peptide/nickel transport system permease protein [Rhizobium sp. BK347]MDK4718012.1 ABC transporter permease [Rhizobium sp. CNPSo 3968]
MKAEILKALKRRSYPRVLTASNILLAVYILLALAAPAIAPQNPYDPLQIYGWEASSPPGTSGSGGYLYLLGTDGLGRDIVSCILYGLRISLIVSVTSAAIAALIGLTAGVSAAYFGKWVDIAIMRLVDLQLSLPTILIALIAIVTLGPGMDRIILALIIAQWATYARLARGIALSEAGKPYMDAARLLRMPTSRIIFRHLLPNSIAPAVTLIPIEIGHAVALEATLSFLGLGVPLDTPSLGSTVANGFQYLLTGQYWISLFPGLALFGLIASINLVGEDIRRRLDPRSRTV